MKKNNDEIQIDFGKYWKGNITIVLLGILIFIVLIPKLPDIDIPRPFWTQATVIGIPECKVTCNCECFKQEPIKFDDTIWFNITPAWNDNIFVNYSFWNNWEDWQHWDCSTCWKYYGNNIWMNDKMWIEVVEK